MSATELNNLSTVSDKRPTRVSLLDVIVEFIRHRDNGLFIALGIGMAIWLLASGPSFWDLLWFAAGWLFFLPQEYLTHVYILHCRVPKFERAYLWFYRLHYGHHDFPKRHDLMYMPLWLTLPMMALNWAIIWAVTPTLHVFFAVYFGALTGYVVFEWAHLLSHVPYVSKSALWRAARNRHLLHHHFDEKRWYMVTPISVAGDGKKSGGGRSSSCRYLGIGANHPWLARARAKFASRSSGDASCSRLWLTEHSPRD